VTSALECDSRWIHVLRSSAFRGRMLSG